MSSPRQVLSRIQMRTLNQRDGESKRDAEIRWQERNDPRIVAALEAGNSKADVARRAGVSKTAIIGAVRRHDKRMQTRRRAPSSEDSK